MRTSSDPQIATKCPKAWVNMVGDSKRRFCDDCKLHVHNFSELNEESRRKLTASDERVCVRYYLAPDGSFFSIEELTPLRKALVKLRIDFAEFLLNALISFLTFLRRCRGFEASEGSEDVR